MAQRLERRPDAERTELLGLDELFVLRGRGDHRNYYVWSYDAKAVQCPLCNCESIKTHGLFSKAYYDLINKDSRSYVIRLNYEFYKFRCLNKKCGHVFSKEIDFASKTDNVTHRMEEAIAKRVIAGYSFGMIEDSLQGNLSRQAVGQIFHRWVENNESCRSVVWSPQQIAILSGRTDNERYTLFLALDDGIKVFDILYGVNSDDIHSTLRKLDAKRIKTIISDCYPIINDAIHDSFPNTLHIIPIQFWLRAAMDDYKAFASEEIRWCTVKKKEELILTPRANLGYRILDLERLLADRPRLKPVYEDINRLCEIIERRDVLWVFDELLEWADSAYEDTKICMEPSLYLLQVYREQIEAQTQQRDAVPARLSDFTSRLQELLSQAKTFSADVLKARVLYSVHTDLRDWHGVPIDDVINTLLNLNIATKRKRRILDEYQ